MVEVVLVEVVVVVDMVAVGMGIMDLVMIYDFHYCVLLLTIALSSIWLWVQSTVLCDLDILYFLFYYLFSGSTCGIWRLPG